MWMNLKNFQQRHGFLPGAKSLTEAYINLITLTYKSLLASSNRIR